MFTIHTVAGGILVLYALIVIIKGRVTVSDGDRSSRGTSSDWRTRSEKPVLARTGLILRVYRFFSRVRCREDISPNT
jgi:hypothetical protein